MDRSKTSSEKDAPDQKSIKHGHGIDVEKAVTINRAPGELYQFWHNLENLPRFMGHLKSVTVVDAKRSHWVAKGPVGTKIEWDAEIVNEVPNELIGWRSLEKADVDNAGSVHFERAVGNQGTLVRVHLRYDPPAGALGAAIAKLLGEEPSKQIEEDLNRLKQIMETSNSSTSGRA